MNDLKTNSLIFDRAAAFADRTAIVDRGGRRGYDQQLAASASVAGGLLNGSKDLNERRIAYMIPSGGDHVAVQWGIWRAGGIAVPLNPAYPLPEIVYILDDTGADTLVFHRDYEPALAPLRNRNNLRMIYSDDALEHSSAPLPAVDGDRRAMILYTSGTTSKPKGVVLTHANLTSQITTLVDAWHWRAADHILHVLPLHHTHGIVNVLCCALWCGATCEMLPAFDAEIVWERLASGEVTRFMAVPTIYVRLIEAWEQASANQQKKWSAGCRALNLMVSGSAALPVPVFERWKSISGHTLLERYGMTEIGMALSNPFDGERRPGHVGLPLPGVDIRLLAETGEVIAAENQPGEIQVKGPNVFREYWGRPEVTAASFRDGWFISGDIAVIQNGYFRILGRSSVDIIKTGGYKVSALEIEEVLLTHPSIRACAVIGRGDEQWGEIVCAALVLHERCSLTLTELRQWCKRRLAAYKAPARVEFLDELPRNAMGKVTKPAIRKLF